jgi:bacterioferritin-associated ferredoxin
VYVCSCHAVTDHQICALRRCGARTVEDVANACKAGSDCGTCVGQIIDLLAAEPETQPQAVSAAAATT